MDALRSLDRLRRHSNDLNRRVTDTLKTLDAQGSVTVAGVTFCDEAPGPSFAQPSSSSDSLERIERDGPLPLFLFYSASSPFSNFHYVDFEIDGFKWSYSEQYFMYAKARLFGDDIAVEAIKKAAKPLEAKRWGRKVKNFDDKVWKAESERLMAVACYRKIQQNSELREALFSTRGRILVEASPRDNVWGVGLSARDPAISDPSKWRGANKLGRILTLIREHMPESGVYTESSEHVSLIHTACI